MNVWDALDEKFSVAGGNEFLKYGDYEGNVIAGKYSQDYESKAGNTWVILTGAIIRVGDLVSNKSGGIGLSKTVAWYDSEFDEEGRRIKGSEAPIVEIGDCVAIRVGACETHPKNASHKIQRLSVIPITPEMLADMKSGKSVMTIPTRSGNDTLARALASVKEESPPEDDEGIDDLDY